MTHIIAVIIVIIMAKLLFDAYKEHMQKKNNPAGSPKKKKGQVIDLTKAWINKDGMPYSRRDHLLMGKELAIYNMLQNILPLDSYVVLPKVNLASSVIVSSDVKNRGEHFNRLKEKSIDLLVCNSADLKPILVVLFETDSEGKKKQLIDRFTRKAVEAAGFPLLCIKPSSPPTSDELMKMLRQHGFEI